MSGLIDSAAAILSSAERQVELSAQNISNQGTPGYKRQLAFSVMIGEKNPNTHLGTDKSDNIDRNTDHSAGRLVGTGNPLDIALVGAGYLQFRSGEQIVYARGGQLTRTAEGYLVNPQGMVVQQSGGGDLTLSGDAIAILEDGTVTENDVPTAALAILQPISPGAMRAHGGSVFSAPSNIMVDSGETAVRSGMIEQSNVVLSDEMIGLMSANRRAEGGARIVQFYDQLMGQAITTFSRSGR